VSAGLSRRRLIRAAVAVAGGATLPATATAPAGNSTGGYTPKVLRVAFLAGESGFDPARYGDLYSSTVCAHIFEPLYTYDPLARPVRIVPLTAVGPAEHTGDFRTWIVRVRPGIYFTPHEAFKGKPRELTAADYVYSLKRIADPANNSPHTFVSELGIRGLDALRQRALRTRQPFDYDSEIEGLRALDRWTLQIRVEESRPRMVQSLAYELHGALAREVVEAHPGTEIAAHPIGTGPFKLGHWRRGSLIVLERNEQYRERYFDSQPSEGDAEGLRILQRLKGRRLPMIDRVEISVITEEQPQWLAFLNGQLDMLDVPGNFAQQAMPNGRLAPYLARRGVHGQQELVPRIRLMYFNMNHPVVGGYAPEKVALRRAVALGMNCARENVTVWGGQAPPTHSVFAPHQRGFDLAFRSEMGEYSPARAKALLDVYGYLDRDGDGWRERPDGQPLLLERASSGGQVLRRVDEGFERDMKAIGIRVQFKLGEFSELIKAARAGKLMMWSLGYNAIFPDGQQFLSRYYSKVETFSRFRMDAVDRMFERLAALPDGDERDGLLSEFQRFAIALMPYKFTSTRIETIVTQPQLVGYRKPIFRNGWYHLVDLEQPPPA
jgi:ABC-type transport system substrate-binding protein